MKTIHRLLPAFLFLAPALAFAAPIPGIFNTGVDANGDLLPADGAVDPHYQMILSPDVDFPGPDAVTLTAGFPVPPWLAEGPDSRWIAPQAISANGSEGEYRFRISFDLTGFNASTANINGEWAVDNEGNDILINGVSTGNSNLNGFGGLTPFTVNSGFVAGVNTLDFVVTNGGPEINPIGLRVKMTGTVEVPGEPPSILDAPDSQSLFAGESLSLSVVGDGTPPLAYQWQVDDVAIGGATSDTFEIPFVQASDAGDYTVVVTNAFGTVTSDVATVSVVQEIPGLFATGVDEGGVPLLDGEVDPHYQLAVNANSESPDAIVHLSTVFPIVAGPWLPNDNASKWIAPLADSNTAAGGDYTYRLTFDLTGFDPTTAFVDGRWSTDNGGLDILINGTSTGNLNTAQFASWTEFSFGPGSFISGINTIDFVLNNASAGPTALRVDSIRGGAASGGGPSGPPVILRQPENQMPEIGATASFSVLADGALPLSYQWRFDGSDLGGATGPELFIFSVSEASVGNYDVVITNGEGTTTSDVAALGILRRPPVILSQPADQFASLGEAVTFSVIADGTMPMSYQWQLNTLDIPGATSADLAIASAAEGDVGNYAVVITNSDGTATSEPATLTLLDQVPGLFNTGVDNDGLVLVDNEIDPHYTLTANANDPLVPDALAMSAIPSPPWVPNSPTSRWIGPTTDSNGAPGLYTFETTFDLLGFDSQTVVLIGSWSSDNEAPTIRLNGVATGISHPGTFDTLLDFTITSGFIEGVNTLEFDVNNAGVAANPVGLRVENLRALGAAVGVPPFQIVDIDYNPGPPASATFTWNSRAGVNYRIEAGNSPASLVEIEDTGPGQGEMTSYTDTLLAPSESLLFYRVVRDD